MSNPIINWGMKDFFEAISIETFSNELKGLSRTKHLTFLCKDVPWLKTIDTEPIDRPHST
jgi:hypothetical protein